MDDEEKTVLIEDTELDIENRLRTKFQAEYDARLQAEIHKISADMTVKNKQILEEAIERFRKEMAPPEEEDIQKLLEQEYVDFKIEIREGPGKEAKVRNFVIAELPIAVEKKIFKKVKDILVPFASEIASMSMNLLEGDAAKKVVQLMNTFEPLLDAMVNVCAVCLNPNGEDEEINEEWVRNHLNSTRIVKIIVAQMEAQHMRDFFSLLFRNTKLLNSR
jgi:hypothetical protein